MWWRVQKWLRSPPRRRTDRWTDGTKYVTHKTVPQTTFLFFSKFLTVNFTHKQRSPQRSVTTRGSSVGDSSIQELFKDSSALWYGWGSPAPMAYTHLPKTLVRSLAFNFWRNSVRTEMKEKTEQEIVPDWDPPAWWASPGPHSRGQLRDWGKEEPQEWHTGPAPWLLQLGEVEMDEAEKAAAEDRERMRGGKKKLLQMPVLVPSWVSDEKKKKVSLKC